MNAAPGRVPPSDLDAESVVLSACMLVEHALAEVSGIVRPDHFYADANRRIYESCLAVQASHKPVDAVAVAGHLRDIGRLDQIGGTPYIAQLTDMVPYVVNVAAHAQRISEKWQLRQLISICQKIAADGYGDTGDIQAFVAQAHLALGGIAGNSPSGSKFALTTSREIFAPLEEPDYVIDRIIRRGSLVELVGYGGGFKTWTALDAVIAVGSGRPWLGRYAVKQGRALYLDYENGQYEMRRRAHALAKAAGLPSVENIDFACMPPVYMSDPKFGAAVQPLAEGCSLVVVDTLKAANPGTDENDSNMRLGLDALRRVGEKTDCAFLVLVHSKKTSGSVSTIDPREAGRGSSAIYDAADTVFHATYVQGEPLRIQQTKSRLGRGVDPFLVTIVDTENGGVLVSAADAPSEGASRSDRFEEVCDSVVAVVKANPGCSARFLRVPVKSHPNTISAALEYLELNGVVAERVREKISSTGKKSKKTGWHFCSGVDNGQER